MIKILDGHGEGSKQAAGEVCCILLLHLWSFGVSEDPDGRSLW